MSHIEEIGDASQQLELSPEERTARRSKVLKRAMLGFGQQYAAQPCVLRDVSETGARIQLENVIALPRHFTLHVEIDGYKVECELVWHRPPYAGIVFIGHKQESALARKQILNDAEHALSEQFVKDYEHREKMQAKEQESRYSSDRLKANTQKPTFGKRHFEG